MAYCPYFCDYFKDWMAEVQNLRHQNDEFTALTHIYLDEFQVLKETAPYKFTVLCKPYKGNTFEYQISIMFEYSKQYPLTPIKYEIEPIAGITRDNINNITKKIDDIIINSQHKPIVFDIVEETRNWIHEYLVDGKALQEEETVVTKIVEVFERPKFAAFTPVTPENFLAWKKEFDLKHKADKGKVKEGAEVKLSGKQWFLGKHGQVVESEQQQDEEQQEQEVQVVEEVRNELFEG